MSAGRQATQLGVFAVWYIYNALQQSQLPALHPCRSLSGADPAPVPSNAELWEYGTALFLESSCTGSHREKSENVKSTVGLQRDCRYLGISKYHHLQPLHLLEASEKAKLLLAALSNQAMPILLLWFAPFIFPLDFALFSYQLPQNFKIYVPTLVLLKNMPMLQLRTNDFTL